MFPFGTSIPCVNGTSLFQSRMQGIKRVRGLHRTAVFIGNMKNSPLLVWIVRFQYSINKDGVSLSTMSDIYNYPCVLILSFLPLSSGWLFPIQDTKLWWSAYLGEQYHLLLKWIVLLFFIKRAFWLIKYICCLCFLQRPWLVNSTLCCCWPKVL